MKTFVNLLIICFISLPLAAQHQDYAKTMEQIKAEQVAFITSELNLTVDEAQRFWPVYNEYQQKRTDLIDKRRQAMRETSKKMASLSEKEKIDLANSHVDIMMEEAKLMKLYHDKFMKVLPAEKVLLYYQAEHRFKNYLFKRYRTRGSDKD
ncbi:MAG TPA: hypothetical protein DCQ31_10790 [Bacteroidales bacterium]|nr:hypothetical protein [Bacteroidales bacterium]